MPMTSPTSTKFLELAGTVRFLRLHENSGYFCYYPVLLVTTGYPQDVDLERSTVDLRRSPSSSVAITPVTVLS
eukprot:1356744-Amorphochlora_amoeboformis.AAC.1